MNTPTTTSDQYDTSLTTVMNSEQRRSAPTTSGLVTRNVADLLPYDRNSRKHGEAQIAQIAASIKEFGFTNPILIDELDIIIAGEGRVQAAKKLKTPTVPCIVLAGLSEAQKAAYVIADNKIALNAGWDDETLLAELGRIAELAGEMSLTGFSEDEIAALLEAVSTGVEELEIELLGPPYAPSTPEPTMTQSQPTVASPSVGTAAPGGAGSQQPSVTQPPAQTAWQGMPDFDQPDAGPFRTIRVHCTDQASVDAFAELIGQKLTEKTKWVWYPAAVKVATEVVYG